jgi:hypothetical protein
MLFDMHRSFRRELELAGGILAFSDLCAGFCRPRRNGDLYSLSSYAPLIPTAQLRMCHLAENPTLFSETGDGSPFRVLKTLGK